VIRVRRTVLSRLGLALLAALTGASAVEAQEGPLRLADALRMARERNPEIQFIRNQRTLAGTRTGVGASGFLPRLSLTGDERLTHSDTDQTFVGQDPRSLRGAETRAGGVGARLDWTVFEGLGRFATMDRLDAQAREAGYLADQAEQGILARVTLAYFDLARQQQQLSVLAEALETSEERLRIAELREEIGSGSEVEARQARVDRNADEAAFLRQRIELTAARADFNRLLGRAPNLPVEVEDRIEVDPDLDLDELRGRARALNPELLRAREGVRIASIERREVGSERFPTLSFQAGADRRRQTSESGFVQESRSTDLFLGVTGSLVLFDGFDRRRRGEEARLREQGAGFALREVEERFEAEFTAAFARYSERIALVALEQENVEIARSNVATALEQFRLGVISSLELREVQESLTRADTRRLESEFELKAAETDLFRLAGLVGLDRGSR
jgi:outer membrane protein